MISTQVLSEFYIVVTRKLGLDPPAALAMVEQLARLPVVAVDASLVTAAIVGSQAWDASEAIATQALGDGLRNISAATARACDLVNVSKKVDRQR